MKKKRFPGTKQKNKPLGSNKRKRRSKPRKAHSQKKAQVPLPAIPGPDSLPLLDKNFNWKKFEGFSRALIQALFPGAAVSLYGKQGNKQKGIDVQVKTKGKLPLVVQCKQYEKFSASNFKAAKKDLKKKVSKSILFLACEASATIRDMAFGDSKWEVWDVNDITSKILKIDPTRRFQILKTYFGIPWAESFCSNVTLSPLSSAFEFFSPYLDHNKIFNHCEAFTGRQSDLKFLQTFLNQRTKQALILSGVGGSGKSRLLWELTKSQKYKDWLNIFLIAFGIIVREIKITYFYGKCV